MTRNQQVGVAAVVGAGLVIGRAVASRSSYSFRDRSVVITSGSRGPRH